MPITRLSTKGNELAPGSGLAYSYERVSSPRQGEGDGLERQETLCSRFCAKHGLKEAGVVRDKGLSAFHRAHQKKGQLRFFIEARKAGEIPAGSTLVVEQWDRFSRSSVSVSEKELHELWDYDLSLSIVSQDLIVTEEKYNSDVSVPVILKLVQKEANFFSQKLSSRIVEKWGTRRKRFAETGVKFVSESDCPTWLSVKDGEYVENDFADTVRLIFDLAGRKGKSALKIARILNEQEIPTSNGKRWTHGNISRILRNRAVLGIKKVRKDGDEEIENYFPSILDRSLHANVRSYCEEKTIYKGRGRAGHRCVNILKGMTFCHCGAVMTSTKSNGRYRLRCTAHSSDCKEKRRSIIYDEELFLSAFMHAHWEKLFKSQLDIGKIRELKSKLSDEKKVYDEHLGELRNLEKKYEKLLKSDEDISAKAINRMEDLIHSTERQVNGAKKKADATSREIKVLEMQPNSEAMEKRVKQGIQKFMAGDRYEFAKREDFNDWCKTLGVTLTFIDRTNPTPRIRLTSDTGSVEMHLYREAGQTVGDTSILDMEAMGIGDEAIQQRLHEILRRAEPLKHDSPVMCLQSVSKKKSTKN